MVMLCVVCAWHAIVAVCPSDVAPYWDYLALISLAIIYTVFHLVFLLWMYFVVSAGDLSFVDVVFFFISLDLSAAT